MATTEILGGETENRVVFHGGLTRTVERTESVKQGQPNSVNVPWEQGESRMKQRLNRVLSGSLILMGLLLPFVWVSLFENYAVIDVGVFRDWAACLQTYGRDLYLNCPLRPNYPTVGIGVTAGVFQLLQTQLGIDDPLAADQWFRYFLAGFESLNFLLLIALFRLSQFRYPIATALGLMTLPSTWAGAAVWGQIDHISLCFLLATIALLLRYWQGLDRAGPGTISQNWLYCLTIPLTTTLYILNKQIALFSFPFLLLVLLITACKLKIRQNPAGLRQFILLSLGFIVIFGILDRSFFTLESNYLHSSFIGVWAEGSGHGNIISGDGANLWVLLERDQQSTSHFPLFSLGNAEVKPYTIGIIAYALVLIFLFQSVFKAVRDRFQISQIQASPIQTGQTQTSQLQNSSDAIALIYLCCFFHGISWLAFNVILTGSHDRHPYLAYASLLLAAAYYGWQSPQLRQHRWRQSTVVFSGFVATAYGLFILSTKSELHPLLFPFSQNAFIATLQAIWLVVLLRQWRQLCGHLRRQQWRVKYF